MAQESRHESGHVNMLVKLLVQFPEIYTISLNLPASSCHLSYMIRRNLGPSELGALRRRLQDGLKMFHYLHHCPDDGHFKLRAKRYHHRLTQLQISLDYDLLLGELISLLTMNMCDLFPEELITENRAGSGRRWAGEGLAEGLPHIPGSGPDRRSSRLIAFRDAGKVYIFDK